MAAMTHLIVVQHCVYPQLVLAWALFISSKVANLTSSVTAIDREAGHDSMTTWGLLAQVNLFHLHRAMVICAWLTEHLLCVSQYTMTDILQVMHNTWAARFQKVYMICAHDES